MITKLCMQASTSVQ